MQASNLNRIITIVGIALLTHGCTSSSFQVPNVDLSEKSYPTSTKISSEDYSENRSFANFSAIEFVVLKCTTNWKLQFLDFCRASIGKIGFREVHSLAEFREKLVAADTGDKGSDQIFSAHAFQEAHAKIGDFLFIEYDLTNTGGAWFRSSVKVSHPKTSETLLKFSHHTLVWSDLDRKINYPVINAINDWYTKANALKN